MYGCLKNKLKEVTMEKNIEKVFKTLTNISLYMSISFASILVLMGIGTIPVSQFMVTILALLLILSICSFIAMPWAKRYGLKNNKKISLSILVATGIFCVLLCISAMLVINIIFAVKDNNELEVASFVKSIKFVKFTFIFTLQFIAGTTIADKYFNFGNNKIPMQVLTALSYISIDTFLTLIVSMMTISSENGIDFDENITTIVTSKFWWSLVAVSFVIIISFKAYMNALNKKSRRTGINMYEQFHSENELVKDKPITPPIENDTNDVRKKLEELKYLFDNQLITQEEYERKKADILKNM